MYWNVQSLVEIWFICAALKQIYWFYAPKLFFFLVVIDVTNTPTFTNAFLEKHSSNDEHFSGNVDVVRDNNCVLHIPVEPVICYSERGLT
jgi:hypothetical protein